MNPDILTGHCDDCGADDVMTETSPDATPGKPLRRCYGANDSDAIYYCYVRRGIYD